MDKARDYAAFGVRHYGLIDPQRRTLEVLTLGDDGRYVDALFASAGAHSITGLPDLVLDLDALCQEIDRLPDEQAST